MKKTKVNKARPAQSFNPINIYLGLVMIGLPLIVTKGFTNITETKSVYFLALSLLLIVPMGIYFISQVLKNKGLKADFSLVDYATGIFGIICLLSAVLSEYQSDVWIGQKSRYQGALVILIYIIVYFTVSRHYLPSQSFLLCSLVAFSLVSFFGVLNCFDIDLLGFYGELPMKYKQAYISTVGNVNFYSSYMCLIFPLIVCGFCQTKNRMSQIIYITSLIVGSFGIMVTSSESFVIGFVLSLVIVPLFISEDKEMLKKFFLSIIIVILSAQVFLLIYKAADKPNIELSALLGIITSPLITALMLVVCGLIYFIFTRKEISLIFFRKVYTVFFTVVISALILCFLLANTVGIGALDSVFRITDSWGTYRGEIWTQCIDVFGDFSLREKLFGVGPEALYRVVEASELHGERILDQAHNEYLQYLLTTGIFGCLSYLFLIGSVAFAVIKKLRKNTLAVALLTGLVSYWVQASVNIAQPFTTPIMYIFIAVIGGMLYNEERKCSKLP